MSEKIVKIADDFWNIRGEFKVGGLLNIGTHCSLVRCQDGQFVLLDAYSFNPEIKKQIDALTAAGTQLKAILNLHPFHTVHVQRTHSQYPAAKLYGTRRHWDKFPQLPWQPERTESIRCAALFAADLEFTVPQGVEFISSNEQLHFASVLAYHKASRTIHSDDTLMYLRLPGLLGKLLKPQIKFHMTLPMTLEKRAGAAREFRDWVWQMADQWQDAEVLCAAHSELIRSSDLQNESIVDKILLALKKVEKTLRAHEKRYG